MIEAVPETMLFDLNADPGESTNVAAKNPDVVAALMKRIESARAELGDIDQTGKGARVFEASRGRKVLVMQVLGQVFMKRPFDDPFSAVDTVLRQHPMGGAVQASLVDVHCEATSEKMAMGHWCDGRASVVVGTHTHVPTSDAMILPAGTAYQTDAGMCGDYNSVIGMQKEEPLRRFITGMPKGRFEPAKGEATLSGLYVETDDRTGKATRVEQVRQGGRLSQHGPDV
jgi:metallophosphoesterase (TIGR00282 family)